MSATVNLNFTRSRTYGELFSRKGAKTFSRRSAKTQRIVFGFSLRLCAFAGHKVASAVLIVLLASIGVMAQPERVPDGDNNHAGTLSELRNKQRALLVVFKSRVIAVDNAERAIIDDVLKADPRPNGRYRWVYNELARKLNKYIRKYGSLSSAQGLSDAEYVIFFNVVEFRRILNATYPYGELFVIVKGSPKESKPPRIIWRAKKVMFASDAIGDLVKDLKAMRGEG